MPLLISLFTQQTWPWSLAKEFGFDSPRRDAFGRRWSDQSGLFRRSKAERIGLWSQGLAAGKSSRKFGSPGVLLYVKMYVVFFHCEQKRKNWWTKTPQNIAGFGIRVISIQVLSNRPGHPIFLVDFYSLVTGETKLYMISSLGSDGKMEAVAMY